MMRCLPLGIGLDIRNGADTDLAAAGPVGFLDAGSFREWWRRWGSRDPLTMSRISSISVSRSSINLVVDDLYHSRDDLPQVVGRNVGGHTDGDTAGSVHQQIRETGRKHDRLLLRLIKVGNKVHGIFIDIRQSFPWKFCSVSPRYNAWPLRRRRPRNRSCRVHPPADNGC